MKVLMANTFHYRRGGDATSAFATTRLLEQSGHTVIPIAMRHPQNEPSVWERWFLPGIDYRQSRVGLSMAHRIPQMIWNKQAYRTTSQLIQTTRPDLLHAHHVHRHLTPSVIEAAHRAGLPVVWTVHDYELICPQGHLFSKGETCEKCRGHRYHHAVVRQCKWEKPIPSLLASLEKAIHRLRGVWSLVDRFLCPSMFLAEKLISFGVPESRVFHLPNCMEVPQALPKPGNFHTSGWCVAGRLSREKGIDIAIEAARLLPDHKLTICGDGPEEQSLRQLARDCQNVQFTGHLPASKLRRVLERSSLVAVPSRWFENQPYAVLEAQMMGRPVVASDIGGIPELIQHNQDGMLIPPANPRALAQAVQFVLENPEKAVSMGLSSQERIVRERTMGQHRDALLDHYQAAINKNR